MDKKDFIFLIIIMLAAVELGTFASIGFMQQYDRNLPQSKKTIVIPAVAPAALSGRWKLLH